MNNCNTLTWVCQVYNSQKFSQKSFCEKHGGAGAGEIYAGIRAFAEPQFS